MGIIRWFSLDVTTRSLNKSKIWTKINFLHNIFGMVKVNHSGCKRNDEKSDSHHVDFDVDSKRIRRRRRRRVSWQWLSIFWRRHYFMWSIFRRDVFSFCRFFDIVWCRFLIGRSVGSWITITLRKNKTGLRPVSSSALELSFYLLCGEIAQR